MKLHPYVTAARLATRGALSFASVFLKVERPRIVNHLPTVRCNLACPFCYVSGPEQLAYNKERYPKQAEMSTEEVVAFYRQLVVHDFDLVVIVGGEPLLRTDLDQMLSVLSGHVFSTVFSNGLVLEDRAELLRHASSLIVSLDAPDDQHDRIRDREGCFTRALAGIERVRRTLPFVKIALNTTVTAGNAGRVPDMLRFARDMDLPIAFQPPSFSGQFDVEGRPKTDGDANLPDAALISAAFRAVRRAVGRQPILGTTAFFDHVIDNQPTFPCHYPSYVLGPVYPNGDVIACTTSRPIANLRETSVADIITGRAFGENAAAGPTCPHGCRDWGIYDLSALYERRMRITDLSRYYGAMAQGFSRRLAAG